MENAIQTPGKTEKQFTFVLFFSIIIGPIIVNFVNKLLDPSEKTTTVVTYNQLFSTNEKIDPTPGNSNLLITKKPVTQITSTEQKKITPIEKTPDEGGDGEHISSQPVLQDDYLNKTIDELNATGPRVLTDNDRNELRTQLTDRTRTVRIQYQKNNPEALAYAEKILTEVRRMGFTSSRWFKDPTGSGRFRITTTERRDGERSYEIEVLVNESLTK